MELADIGWDEPSVLFSAVDGAGRRLDRPLAVEGSLLESVRRAVRMIDLPALTIRCPRVGFDIREGELRGLFRTPGLYEMTPVDGDEANVVVVGARCGEPVPAPCFRGRFDEARGHVSTLSPEERERAWLVTHGEVYSPARLAALAPPIVASSPKPKPRRFLSMRLPA